MRTDIRPLVRLMDEQGIRLLTQSDAEFPRACRDMVDPPFVLFVRGAPLKDALHVAIVGTRKMSPYGKRATTFLSGELTRYGITVVSGLAFGVDLAAHDACIEAGGTTIAVLGGGIDNASITPPFHIPIAQKWLAQNVLTLVSEYPPGAGTQRFQYLLRNRIIAALGKAVVVTDADYESGAITTAKCGLENGREVLAVPGDIFLPTCRGTNLLITEGAKPCRNAEDILAAIGFRHPENAKQIAAARAAIPLDPQEQSIVDALKHPQSADELSRALKQPIATITALISVLELKGRIISVGPRTYVANAQ